MRPKYKILRTLGRGGMGELYLASEVVANRERLVVIKEMLDYYDPKDPQGKVRARQRFETEAAVLASLSVPGVPQVFEYFSEGGRNYIVMQFIEGQNLETALTHFDDNDVQVQGRAYPVEQVRQWGVELCHILEILAAQNIVHMDIKPANLIQDKAGDIWLVDFGTVKTQPSAPSAGQAGMAKPSVYGTLGYAPPEQINGKAEPRSDVYALAATLYHLMTDDDPADPPGAFAQMKRLPNDIAQALRRALAVDINQRVTAAEFGRLLVALASGALPFHWRDGTTTHQPKDLAATANRNWGEALDYFQGGDWEKWLRGLHQNNLAAALQAIRARQPNLNLALDEFLRLLDPAFPAPRLHAAPPSLDGGVLPWKSNRQLSLQLENLGSASGPGSASGRGSGCLHGRVVSLHAAMQVEPDQFVTHGTCQIGVKIDAGLLSPEAHPQTLHINIDAGKGGQLRLPVKVSVPEPQLVMEGGEVDFGRLYKGEKSAYLFQVSNAGGSPFLGEVRSKANWVTVEPQFFDCAPGGAQKLNVQVDTRNLVHSAHAARLQVWARAGRWDQVAPLNVQVEVSRWRTFVKYWLPALLMISLVAGYGGLLGSILVSGIKSLVYPMIDAWVGVLIGVLLGIVIFAIPLAPIGALGGLGKSKGKEGALNGARYGAAAGALAGALAGWLAFGLLSWLGLLGAGGPIDFFGGLAGALSGGVLGGALYYLSRNLD